MKPRAAQGLGNRAPGVAQIIRPLAVDTRAGLATARVGEAVGPGSEGADAGEATIEAVEAVGPEELLEVSTRASMGRRMPNPRRRRLQVRLPLPIPDPKGRVLGGWQVGGSGMTMKSSVHLLDGAVLLGDLIAAEFLLG